MVSTGSEGTLLTRNKRHKVSFGPLSVPGLLIYTSSIFHWDGLVHEVLFYIIEFLSFSILCPSLSVGVSGLGSEVLFTSSNSNSSSSNSSNVFLQSELYMIGDKIHKTYILE